MRHAWCTLLAISSLTASSILRAETTSELPTNVRTASDSAALPANAVASSANTPVSASANGSVPYSAGTSHGSEGNSLKTGDRQAVASDTTSSVATSASGRPVANAANLSQTSVAPTQTAPTGTSNGVPVPSSTGSATRSSATGTSDATVSNATTATAAGATISASPVTGAITSATNATNSITASTETASIPPNIAHSSQALSALKNVRLGTTVNSGTNGNTSTLEEEEPQDLGDILDLRPPAKLKVSLLLWVIALLVVLSAIGLWFLLKRKRRGKAKKEKPTKPIDPYEEVLQALKEVSKKLDVTNPKPFAFFLTDAVRLYLSRIFRLPAPECTTQELLQQLPWCTELTDDLRTNITQFLQRCDLVKFTTMPFDEPFLLQLYQQAEAIVAASHELTKPKPAPAASVATGAAPSSKPEKTSKK